MTQQKIGFIGLGLMGAAMVERLQSKGYSVVVLGNKTRARIDAAIERGAVEASSAKELAEKSDIIMLCMGTSDSVESRMYGDDGVIAGVKEGTIVIDFGTSLPPSTKAIGAKVAEAGGTYMDAPLGRTPLHAIDGLLNIMCSGDKATFDKIEPVLNDLGENVFHLGELGAGHSLKLINNFYAMTIASAMCEAFVAADKAGVDRQQLYDVMSAGPLGSGMMEMMRAYAVDGDSNQLAFTIKNASKDVGYFLSMAKESGFSSFLAPGTANILGEAIKDGAGEGTVATLLDFITERNK